MPYWIQRDFSGGMNTLVQPRRLQPNELADILNFDLRVPGELRRRPGYTILRSGGDKCRGLGKYQDSSGVKELIAAMYGDGNEYLKYDGATFTSIGTVPGDLVHWFAMGIRYDGSSHETLFISNGSSNLGYYDTGGVVSTTAVVGAPRCLCWFRDRLWYVKNASRYELYWSDYRDGTNVTVSGGSVYINDGDGQIITGLAPTPRVDGAELLVLKDRSIYAANLMFDAFVGTQVNETTSMVRVVSAEAGLFAPHSGAWLGDQYMMLSHDGVRALQVTGIAPLTAYTELRLSKVPLSTRVQSFIDRINWAQRDKFWAEVYNGKYYLTVALDAETEPTTQLVYDSWSDNWTAYDWEATSAKEVDFSSVSTLFIGGNALGQGEICEIDEDAYADGTSDQDGHFTTVAFDANAPHIVKEWLNVELTYLVGTTTESVTIYYSRDAEPFELLKTEPLVGTDHPTLPLSLPFTLSSEQMARMVIDLNEIIPSRDIQLRFAFSGQGSLQIFVIAIRFVLEGEFEEEVL